MPSSPRRAEPTGGPPGPAQPALGRSDRRLAIVERDGDRCVWCGRTVGVRLVPPTTEHLVPRVKGGPSWVENEVVACARCNHQRGHRTPADWADECERRGWPVNRATIAAALASLEAAIARRGGQRRARRYVISQRRRFG